MKRSNVLFLTFLVSCFFTNAQGWSLKVSSHIGFRKFALDTRIIKDEKMLSAASVKLTQGGKLIEQTISDADGYYSINVPANGEFILSVTSSGCVTKKIYINTNDVPAKVQKENFKPSINIEGFVLYKPMPGIDYSSLDQTLARIVYIPNDKNFGDEEMFTKEGLAIVARIEESEMELMNRFVEANKAGDEALKIQNCVLAKKMFESALAMLPAEKYPAEQMELVEMCFDQRAEVEKIAQQKEAERAFEEKYNETIRKGDEGLRTKNWSIAIEAYNEAIALKPNEEYPKLKRESIDKLIFQDVEKSDTDKAGELKNKYDGIMNRAETLMAKKLWNDAEEAYYEALDVFPDQKYPKDQIVAINRILSRENAGNDKKFKEAIVRSARLNDQQYAKIIKKIYEDALTYESDAVHLKKLEEDNAKNRLDAHKKALLEKYPSGLTEEIINGNGVVIVKRILVKNNDVWVYQKKIFNWGGISCFRDDLAISSLVFENEAKL
jgi:epidermal growth factor receptor substrate 15